jgi:hypothetical protein
MESYLKEALEIVKAQASVRTMTEEEITTMVRKLAGGIKEISASCAVDDDPARKMIEPKKAIKKNQLRA